MGPTYDGPLGPIFLFWLFQGLVLRREITKGSSEGWRCSVFGHEMRRGWSTFRGMPIVGQAAMGFGWRPCCPKEGACVRWVVEVC